VAKAVLVLFFNPSAKADGNKLLNLTTLIRLHAKNREELQKSLRFFALFFALFA
jgi:hypothetical protein